MTVIHTCAPTSLPSSCQWPPAFALQRENILIKIIINHRQHCQVNLHIDVGDNQWMNEPPLRTAAAHQEEFLAPFVRWSSVSIG